MAKTSSKRVPLVGGSYEEQSKNYNSQRTVNLYPVTSLNGKDRSALVSRPGLAQISNVVFHRNTVQYDPNLNRLFGLKFSDGTPGVNTRVRLVLSNFPFTYATTSYVDSFGGYTANILGTSSKTYGESSTQDASKFVFLNGSNVNYAFVYDKTNASNSSVAFWEDAITPTVIEQLDGYFIINESSNTNPATLGRFYANTLTNLGNVCWTSLDFATTFYRREPIKDIITTSGYLYLFTPTHYEIWYNAGTTVFPFEPIKEATKEIGWLASTKFGNQIALIGRDGGTGNAGLYLINGLEYSKVSTPYIDALLTKDFDGGDKVLYFVTYDGRTFIHVTVKNRDSFYPNGVDGVGRSRVLAYDLFEKEWHEETFFKLHSDYIDAGIESNFIAEDWDVIEAQSVSNAESLLIRGGASAYIGYNGELAKFTNRVYKDYTLSGSLKELPIPRYRVTQHIAGEDNYAFHKRVRLDMESVGSTNTQANIWLYSSDDDTKTWYSYPAKSFANTNIGSVSGDKRIEWFRLGRSDDRIYKIFTNANAPVTIVGGFADVEGGTR